MFFPSDQLGLFPVKLGDHLGRTVYTNAQNVIVVGWWIGALLLALVQRDQFTLFSGLVIGVGFGAGFPLAAVWCLGYTYAPGLVDWWKMWELQSGLHMGMLYVAVLYWVVRHIDVSQHTSGDLGFPTYRRRCETLSLVTGTFLLVYVMARDEFGAVGILLGLFYVIAMCQTLRYSNEVVDRRRAISFVYSVFLLVFIMTWGASAQVGMLFGFYDTNTTDQYAWPTPRILIFAPVGIVVVGTAWLMIWKGLNNPRMGGPPYIDSSRVSLRVVDLMTFSGVVGAATIWPSKIGVVYACLLAIALFAFGRLNRHFDR